MQSKTRLIDRRLRRDWRLRLAAIGPPDGEDAAGNRADQQAAEADQHDEIAAGALEAAHIGGFGNARAQREPDTRAMASVGRSIGAPELKILWRDPEFNPALKAFYYVRVLEIPTPRWVLFDALRYGARLLPDTQLKAQERAYSSPIWYNPKAA